MFTAPSPAQLPTATALDCSIERRGQRPHYWVHVVTVLDPGGAIRRHATASFPTMHAGMASAIHVGGAIAASVDAGIR
jgi:hypothetical protein